MRINSSILFFILLFTIATSCNKDAEQPDLGYNYFPTEVGSWVIYDVDSIVHDDFTGKNDTFQFQIKEVLESDFIDNEGRTSQRIERLKKKDDTSAFVIQDVWFQTRTVARAERIEENFRTISLIFPVKEGQTWNGNALNIKTDQEFGITQADITETINGNAIDSVAKVLQQNQQNIIENRFRTEWYARNIGLVYKEIIDLDLQKDAGLEYKMQLHSFGKN